MSIGSQLRQAREAQFLSLDQAAQATHIRLHYLEALESDQFQSLPSTAHVRGFIRAYSDYLKLDSAQLILLLDKKVESQAAPDQPPRVTEISAPSTSSEAIFKELGSTLKSQRELMGLSLGDVERHTHIRMHYIDALERGDIGHLPSPVQGRGMLSNYASFLGLNTESILLLFADGLQADLYDRQAARKPSKTSPLSEEAGGVPSRPSKIKRLFSVDLFAGGFIIIFLLGFTIWGGLRISKLSAAKEPSPTAPPISAILLASPGSGSTTNPTPNPSAETSAIPTVVIDSAVITATFSSGSTPIPGLIVSTPGLENAPVQVNIIADQRAWMRVTVDGESAFEGRVTPGSAYTFAGNDRIELLTGDASALRVYFNQQDLGPLGSFGQVIERIFTLSGVETATPSIPSTSTPAPTNTITPTPTATVSGPSATPSPTVRP